MFCYFLFLFASSLTENNDCPITRTPKEEIFALPGGSYIEMVWIEPGSFIMGSPESENGRENNEGPQHRVTISKGFWLGKYEVTQGQWESVMQNKPWEGQVFVKENPRHPAVYISWNDVQQFISKLNTDEVLYRLPTEAEWEYSCRAGSNNAYSYGNEVTELDKYAWHGKNTYDLGNMFAHEVGKKLPNQWGLYDMHGNVWEWVQDYYGQYSDEGQTDPKGPQSGINRVFRGGSFYYLAHFTRSAYRGYNSPRHRLFNLGARLLREER